MAFAHQIIRRNSWWRRPSCSAKLRTCERLSNHKQSYANLRMHDVEEEVLLIYVVDVAVVGKQPTRGPGVQKHKCVSREDELGLIGNDLGGRDHPIDCERMLPAEVGLEFRIRNMRALARWTGLSLLGRRAMLFVSRFLLFLLFCFGRLRLWLLFWRFRFLLASRRCHFRLTRWWRNLALFRLLRSTSVLCRGLRVTEHGQTHQQSQDRSKSDSLHSILLFARTRERSS